ncbi:hypothetical protein FIBSPDRAFT_928414 [Athelia psychrophila]|uniref:Uncharacterized protein n=1 Tax=Athelia psychrophila TaxID=1759441 RepID=A0A166Q3X3_9AGAM|nr:hypothetical protein FIBSPDRAFT_928414 [Fibularhizoctonia sp. CBS 109695]
MTFMVRNSKRDFLGSKKSILIRRRPRECGNDHSQTPKRVPRSERQTWTANGWLRVSSAVECVAVIDVAREFVIKHWRGRYQKRQPVTQKHAERRVLSEFATRHGARFSLSPVFDPVRISCDIDGPMNLQVSSPRYGAKFIAWDKSNKVNIVVEGIGEDATLPWMDEKRVDRGGYLIPYADGAGELLRHISLKAGGGQLGFGIVMLDFSAVTERPFPTQVTQANLAIAHLCKYGVRPENLKLIGDSAGGNLILPLFSHALHDIPDPGFPPSPLRSIIDGTIYMPSIRGAYGLVPRAGEEALERCHADVMFVEQEGGIHLEPIFGFTGRDGDGEVTQALVDWHKSTFGL